MSHGTLRRLDLLAAVLILAIGLSAPIDFDEGWLAITIERYLETGRFSLVLGLGDVDYTFQKPWFWLASVWFRSFEPVTAQLLPRLSSIGLSIGAWLVMRATFRRLGFDSPAASLVLLFFFVKLTTYFFFSARTEALVAFAACLVFHAFVRQALDGIVWPYLFAAGVIAVAVPAHHLGAYAALILALALAMQWHRLALRQKLAVAAGCVACAVLGIRLLLWDLSPAEWLAAHVHWTGDRSHAYDTGEWTRYRLVLRLLPDFAAAAVIALGGLAVPALRRALPAQLTAFLLLSVAIAAVFLFFHPAKWPYYVVIYLPAVGIAAAAGIHAARPSSGLLQWSAAALVLTAVVLAAMRIDGLALSQPGPQRALLIRAGLSEASVEDRRTDTILSRGEGRVVRTDPTLKPMLPRNMRFAPLSGPGPAPEVVVVRDDQLDGAPTGVRQESFLYQGSRYHWIELE